MYTSLHIKGFRCFRDLEIPKLARINLIGGRNNTGKTALLEAMVVFEAAAPAPDPVIANLYGARGLHGRAMIALGFSDLIADRPATGEAWIAAREGGREGRSETSLRVERPEGVERAVGGPSAPGEQGGPVDALHGLEPKRLVIGADGMHASLTILPDGELRSVGRPDALRRASMFLPARQRVDHGFLAQVFTALRVERRQGRLIGALQHLEPSLSNVELGYLGDPELHADTGGPRLVPLSLLGEGMNRLAELILGLSHLTGGVLLVDEIENGLHHSVMPKVWAAIADAATELDVQVFATTHSYECVEAAVEAMGEDEGLLLYHRLDRIDGEISSVTYEPDVLRAAFETYLEVR